MMIEDDELRTIFKTASEEHLQNLDSGLLHLEKYPNDQDTLEALLREAHSLKGDANMLGVKDVGTLAHQLEHIFGQLTRQEETLTADLADRMGRAIAAIHRLVNEAITGEPAGIDPFRVLAELMGAKPVIETPTNAIAIPEEPSPETGHGNNGNGQTITTEMPAPVNHRSEIIDTPTAEKPPAEAATLTAAKPPTAALEVSRLAKTVPSAPQTLEPNTHTPTPPSTQPSTPNPTYRIETIRVATQNLDTLMTQAGELTVTKIRIAHRLAEIETISNLWEEWSRDLFLNRFVFDEVIGDGGKQNSSALHRLKSFHGRTEDHLEQLGALIRSLRGALYEDTTRLEVLSDELEEGIRTLRLLPLSTIFNLFPRMVRDLARQQDKQVELVIEGGETRADKRILEEMKDPLMHILRNAIDHGIECPTERQQLGKPATATIRLRGYQTPTSIVIEVSDDGRGLNLDRIRQTALKRGICREDELATMAPEQIQSLIFTPGFSTAPLVTEVSGRGVGLDVVQTNVEKLKGTVQVESIRGQGCTMRVQVGLTLATAHVLIVTVNQTSYGIPVEFVRTACLVQPEEIFTLEGRDTIIREGQPLSVARLANLLELPGDFTTNGPPAYQKQRQLACIVLQVGQEQLGVFVDALVDEQDVVIKPQSQLLKRVRNVSGATILGTGEVCMVLNPQDLVKSLRRQAVSITSYQAAQGVDSKQSVLLVEDSIATRTQEKRILEAAGYEVVTAVDGLDGFTKLQSRSFNAIVSDVQMPNLDGLGLAAKIRQHKEYNEIPIILVTSLASDADKQRGAEAGANAYITKGNFNQEVLLDTLQRLI